VNRTIDNEQSNAEFDLDAFLDEYTRLNEAGPSSHTLDDMAEETTQVLWVKCKVWIGSTL
jgi:hypothetical protein